MDQPQLGYGKQSEASIDAVNQWMRSQPWWQQIAGTGPVHLNDQQKRAVMHAAQANGVVIDEGDMEIDPAGNLNPKGHKLRNTLIVMGAAAAAIAAPYALSALGSGGGAAAGGAAATGAGTAGVEAGVTAGLGSAALPGAMASLPAIGGSAATLAPLASTTIGNGAMGPITGGTGLAGKTATGGILSKLTSPETLSGVADTLGGAAKSSLQQNNNADLMNAANERTRLERDKFALTAPGTRLKDSTLASLGSNWQPTKVDWGPGGFHPGAGTEGKIPTFSGGLSGGMQNLDPRTKELQSKVMDDELQSQMSGGPTGGGKDTFMPPPVTPLSGGDKALGYGATTAGILAALAKSGLLSKLVGG